MSEFDHVLAIIDINGIFLNDIEKLSHYVNERIEKVREYIEYHRDYDRLEAELNAIEKPDFERIQFKEYFKE